jgi:hypothetical protein
LLKKNEHVIHLNYVRLNLQKHNNVIRLYSLVLVIKQEIARQHHAIATALIGCFEIDFAGMSGDTNGRLVLSGVLADCYNPFNRFAPSHMMIKAAFQ